MCRRCCHLPGRFHHNCCTWTTVHVEQARWPAQAGMLFAGHHRRRSFRSLVEARTPQEQHLPKARALRWWPQCNHRVKGAFITLQTCFGAAVMRKPFRATFTTRCHFKCWRFLLHSVCWLHPHSDLEHAYMSMWCDMEVCGVIWKYVQGRPAQQQTWRV